MGYNMGKLLRVLGLSLTVAVVTGCSTTAEYSSAVMRTMVNQSENITATGYAVISVQLNDNPAQQRLLSIRSAKLDAYRVLLEQVYGQYLDVNTTVGEMVVQSDTFRSRVQGVIYGAQLVSITPVGDDTYTVTLALDRSIVDDLRMLYIDQMALKQSGREQSSRSIRVAREVAHETPSDETGGLWGGIKSIGSFSKRVLVGS